MQGFEGVPALGLRTSACASGALCLKRGKGLGYGIADREARLWTMTQRIFEVLRQVPSASSFSTSRIVYEKS